MDHGLASDIIYRAVRVKTVFAEPNKEVNGLGTGFFVKTKRGLHLVTNRHVVDPNYEKRRDQELKSVSVTIFSKDETTQRPDHSMELKFPDCDFNFAQDYRNDVAVLHTKGVSFDLGDMHKFKGVGGHTVNVDELATRDDFEKIMPGDFLSFVGYPEWATARPILRSGCIASDPRYNDEYQRKSGDVVLFEGFSSAGGSGSPVFSHRRSVHVFVGEGGLMRYQYRQNNPPRGPLLIGVNAGHIIDKSQGLPQHAGLSCFYKSYVFREMIEEYERNLDATSPEVDTAGTPPASA